MKIRTLNPATVIAAIAGSEQQHRCQQKSERTVTQGSGHSHRIPGEELSTDGRGRARMQEDQWG